MGTQLRPGIGPEVNSKAFTYPLLLPLTKGRPSLCFLQQKEKGPKRAPDDSWLFRILFSRTREITIIVCKSADGVLKSYGVIFRILGCQDPCTHHGKFLTTGVRKGLRGNFQGITFSYRFQGNVHEPAEFDDLKIIAAFIFYFKHISFVVVDHEILPGE